jgi:CHAD domain-containing protein
MAFCEEKTMSDGKWIENLTGDMPVAEAARRVLAIRLGVVRDRLAPALHEAERDTEHIHQLRVGTRRARAALDIFADALPAKVHRKASKRLRRLRRAAGAARDWDVFLDMLSARAAGAPERQRPGLDFLMGYASGQRTLAQQALHEAAAHPGLDAVRLVEDTVAAVRESDTGHLIDLARPLLTQLVRDLEQAGAGDLHQYEHLHQVRILGKRLRYAMEIFEGCFAADFREEYYPAVEEMQEILGTANDSYVASRRLAAIREGLRASRPDLWKRCGPGLDALWRYHQRRLPQQRVKFAAWWQRWQESGAEAAFAHLLKSKEPPAAHALVQET